MTTGTQENNSSFFLDRLYRVSKIITLPDGVRIVVRALSDSEMSFRQREATKISAIAQKKVNTPGTDEHNTVILPIENADEDVLRAALSMYFRDEAMREARERVQPEYIPIPDKATPDEEREVLSLRETAVSEALEKRQALAVKLMGEKIKSVESHSLQQLFDVVRRKSSATYSDSVYMEAMADLTIYTCAETEKGERFFKSLDDVRGTARFVREQIMAAFSEVNDVDPLSLNGQS